MDAYLDRLKGIIQRHGHAVQYVFADAQSGQPPFAYTVGLHRARGYELTLSGLPYEVSRRVLNSLAARLETGPVVPAPGLEVAGVLAGGYVLRLAQVGSGVPFTMLRAVYGTAGWMVPLWQAVWPDADGRFPGEEGYRLAAGAQVLF